MLHNSLNNFDKQRTLRDYLAFACIISMMIGFVASRAILSISMIAFAVVVFWPTFFKELAQKYLQNKFAILCTLFFLLYVISGLWSENKTEWWRTVVHRLPFVLLPFGLNAVPIAQPYFRKLFIAITAALLSVLMLTSLFIFLGNHEKYVQDVAYSKQIPTTQMGDHIRYSLLLCLFFLFLIRSIFWDNIFRSSKAWKWLMGAVAVLIIIYLHVLSAKTGLLGLYMIIGALGFYALSKKMKATWAATLSLSSIVLIAALGYLLIPTIRQKVVYLRDEYRMIASGKHLDYNWSDMGRLISYQIAFHEIKEHGALGTGAGDALDAMKTGYATLYPEIPADRQFVPFNQYVVELLTFGKILSLIFVAMILCPFFYKRKSKTYFFVAISTLVLIVAMMVEATLQVQLGVFVYLFFTMLWYVIEEKDKLSAVKRTADNL